MAILSECPQCHRKRSVQTKACVCGQDMDKAKRSKKVKYWIDYQIPGEFREGEKGGKVKRAPVVKREYVGTSIEEARDAEGKRRVQKRENRIFDMLPDANLTFRDLTEWYLALEDRQKLDTFTRVKGGIANFNNELDNRIVSYIKPIDLENYQNTREKKGAPRRLLTWKSALSRRWLTRHSTTSGKNSRRAAMPGRGS